MLQRIRRSYVIKTISLLMVIIFVDSIVHPTILLGQNSNPDYYSNPAGASQMVDLSTGNFHYSIPLLEVEGYPITLNYNAGVTMEQEASWVGLGWTLNPGAINRQMRGIPDDFKGDTLIKKQNRKKNITKGGGATIGGELAGAEDLGGGAFNASLSFGINADVSMNNYTGLGFSLGYSLSPSAGVNVGETSGFGLNASASISQSVGNQSGVTNTHSASFNVSGGKSFTQMSFGKSFSSSYNSISNNIIKQTTNSYNISTRNTKVEQGKETIENSDGEKVEVTNFKKVKGAIGGSVLSQKSIPQGSISFPPSFQFSNVSESFSFSATAGGETPIVPFYGKAGVRYNQSESGLLTKINKRKAFGYMYHHEADKELSIKQNVLMDYTRFGDKRIHKEIAQLPFSYLGNDIFSLSGAGLGGTFTTKRNDYGFVGDINATTTGDNNDLGAEAGIGGIAKVGVNYNTTSTIGNYGIWFNDITKKLKYRGREVSDDFRPYYFEMSGETKPSKDYLRDQIGGDEPVNFMLKKSGSDGYYEPKSQLSGSDFSVNPSLSQNYEQDTETGNQAIIALNAEDASVAGVDTSIFNYQANNFTYSSNGYSSSLIDRVDHAGQKPHHISEFTVLNPNGDRYVYGVPVYTRKEVQKSFNVSGNSDLDLDRGIIGYTPGSDNTVDNTRGEDNSFSSNETPEYVSSFLLSGKFSKDYQDVTQNGPTPDDIGSYLKFNYSRTSSSYISRSLQDHNKAAFDPGFYSDPEDDRGSYSYSEKELWYIHSMESKNYIVEYRLNDPVQDPRLDGYGIADENGGLESGNPSKRYLKEIRLYSRQDKLNNGSNAVPLKTIMFKYTYDLCPNYMGTSGKLTLQKVFILDHRSKEGMKHPYEFSYGNNKGYNPENVDRWGNFKEQATISSTAGVNENPTEPWSNREYPFTPQNQSDADDAATAWNLNEIKTPSGSRIEVEYESDTYGYVQDIEAMKMYDVVGIKYNDGSTSSQLYKNLREPGVYLEVDISSDPVSNMLSDPEQYFFDRYLRSQKHGVSRTRYLSYNFFVRVGKKDHHWERIKGYMPIRKRGIKLRNLNGNNEYETALIPIENQITNRKGKSALRKSINSFNANPVSEMSMQMTADYLSNEVVPGLEVNAGGVKAFIMALLGMVNQKLIKELGYPRFRGTFNNSKYFIPSKSYVRMFCPDLKKYGGGHRVKSIKVYDEWDEFSDFYGVEYSYETEIEGVGTTTSGVASNEPFNGKEENSLIYSEKARVAENIGKFGVPTKTYNEMPVGLPVLPNPGVVYSRVRTEAIQKSGINFSRTGYKIESFYTAKDFPAKTSKTSLDLKMPELEPSKSFFKTTSKSVLTATQGFSVELNDMHGKHKKSETFDINGNLTKSREVFYRTSSGELNNYISGIDKTGSIVQDYEVGVERQFLIDAKTYSIETKTKNRNVNTDIVAIPFPFLPFIIIPTVFFSTSKDKQVMRTMTCNKIINKYGIIDEVVTTDQGSRFTQKNHFYDVSTGRVLVSSSSNYLDRSKPKVTYNYPAYWVHPGVGKASDNLGLRIDDQILNTSDQIKSSYTSIFKEGDELLRTEITSNNGIIRDKVWVLGDRNNVPGSWSYLFLIDKNGDLVTEDSQGVYSYKVVRSGSKNMLNSDIQEITRLQNGSNISQNLIFNNSTVSDIVEAKAIEVIDRSKYLGLYGNECLFNDFKNLIGLQTLKEQGDSVNPLLLGLVNNWHVSKTLKPETLRIYGSPQSGSLASVELKTDGVFSLDPAYTFQTGSFKNNMNDDWVVSNYNMNQNSLLGPLEIRDINQNYTAQQVDYFGRGLNATMLNSRANQSAFEDFEDHVWTDYSDLPGDFKDMHQLYPLSWTQMPDINTSEGHSGEVSMKLSSGSVDTLLIPIVETDDDYRGRHTVPYSLNLYDLTRGLQFDNSRQDELYSVSLWMKNEDNSALDISNLRLLGSANCGNYTVQSDIEGSSNSIDGWKQANFTISISRPSSTPVEDLLVLTFNNIGTKDILIDDLRILPLEASMSSKVYDRYYQRPVAEINENNFSTFYQYNHKGTAAGLKKETVRGIHSIKESSSSKER